MFDVAFSELVIIGIVALLVFGPERLPELARTASRWIARARDLVWSVRQEIEREFDTTEIRRASREWHPSRLRAWLDPKGADATRNNAGAGDVAPKSPGGDPAGHG